MTARTIRDIQFEKGKDFTTKFIKKFDKDWTGTVNLLKKNGKFKAVRRVKNG